jgi:hypothetical protein
MWSACRIEDDDFLARIFFWREKLKKKGRACAHAATMAERKTKGKPLPDMTAFEDDDDFGLRVPPPLKRAMAQTPAPAPRCPSTPQRTPTFSRCSVATAMQSVLPSGDGGGATVMAAAAPVRVPMTEARPRGIDAQQLVQERTIGSGSQSTVYQVFHVAR